MDIMLYIIAGLVVIVVIGVLVMRKNKTQEPVQPPLSTNKTPTPPKQAASTATNSATATKFDNLTVAQRFIDQQRYDKALEALERGLIEKPHDNALSLKMLHIYAITNQYDHFHRTYDAINTRGDAATIAEAQQLKTLLDQEQTSTVPAATAPAKPDEESLDFDLSISQAQDTPINPQNLSPNDSDLHGNGITQPFTNEVKTTDITTVSTSDNSDVNDINNDNFDLTLDDLESDPIIESTEDKHTHTESAPTVASSFDTANSIDGLNFEAEAESGTDTLDTAVPIVATQANDISNFDDDFKLDFEPSHDVTDDEALESQTDDDFVLDFEDLALEVADLEEPSVNTSEVQTDDTPVFDALTLEDESIETDADTTALNSTSPTFDDNTPITDDFDLNIDNDAPAVTALTAEDTSEKAQFSDPNSHQPVDFDAQFDADFDFVKSLDSQQVTLDLATKYLELGEYDSAKRLLTEVVNDGNEEQQQQAKALLTRTA